MDGQKNQTVCAIYLLIKAGITKLNKIILVDIHIYSLFLLYLVSESLFLHTVSRILEFFLTDNIMMLAAPMSPHLGLLILP